MAKKIANFDFSSNRYDWDNWLDGGIWVLTQGEDFEVDFPSFRSVAFLAADRAGKKVRTSVNSKEKTMTIQAYKNGE